MFHPVGSLPSSVYWRRRAVLLGSFVVLIVLTAYVLRPGGGGGKLAGAAGPASIGAAATTSVAAPSSATSAPPPTPAASTSASATAGATHSATSAEPPPRCSVAALRLAAVVEKPSYRIGDQPNVMLQVTNPSATACVQDLADQQIELRIYNGESRVWGSHDCQVQPGTADRTLNAGQSVRISIVWSGLSSQPQCAGTRQRVGAGTYTLYGLLAGREGTAAQFVIN